MCIDTLNLTLKSVNSLLSLQVEYIHIQGEYMSSSKKIKDPVKHYTGIGVALGVAFGTAFGASYDATGIGLALGIAIGAAIGASIGNKHKNKQDADI